MRWMASRRSVSTSAAASKYLGVTSLSLKIRPLQRRRHQLHEVVHKHAASFLRIEQEVSQPGVNTPSPLLQVECWEGRVINSLQRQQNITHFRLGVAGDPTIGVNMIQSSPKLYPHRFWLVKEIFERDGSPTPCCNQAQSQRGSYNI